MISFRSLVWCGTIPKLYKDKKKPPHVEEALAESNYQLLKVRLTVPDAVPTVTALAPDSARPEANSTRRSSDARCTTLDEQIVRSGLSKDDRSTFRAKCTIHDGCSRTNAIRTEAIASCDATRNVQGSVAEGIKTQSVSDCTNFHVDGRTRDAAAADLVDSVNVGISEG